VRFTADEYAELAAAAAWAGLTPTGYVGEVALAAARGVTAESGIDPGAITRAELAQLQRDLFAARIAVNQAAASLRRRRCIV
jgi:murein L,D-transpeptidase YcbB/YkuD